MFDDAGHHGTYVEMYRGEGVPGATSGAVHCYEGFPEESAFPELIAGYAAWDGRVKQ
jgi:hypothetical protein